jgi:putative transposase
MNWLHNEADVVWAAHTASAFKKCFTTFYRSPRQFYPKTRTHQPRAKFLMEKQPKTVITDGLRTYSSASMVVFPEATHIRHIQFRGDRNNNKMERFNGEILDREKTMRGLKTKETAILTGYQLFHNYIRPHEGL